MTRLPIPVRFLRAAVLTAVALAGCDSAPDALAPAQPADVTVKMDFLHKPLPDIPLPNDIATRFDANAATRRRINASMVAPTSFERLTREKVDELDGWGTFTPITVPFTGAIDLPGVVTAHHGDDYAFADDLVYVVNITKNSPDYGKPVALDVGNGNYPVTLEDRDGFWEHDARGQTLSLLFEEENEDANGNGKLDPGEDTDLDGKLDLPNRLPGLKPAQDDLVGRANALMTFYERETNTLMLRPLIPLRERETYAVVVTRRLKDANGKQVGSPYEGVNHAAQTEALQPLVAVLAEKRPEYGGLALKDLAFAWSFTTGSMTTDIVAVRDGLYGYGAQKHLAKEFPPDLELLHEAWDTEDARKSAKPLPPNLFVVPGEKMIDILRLVSVADIGLSINEKTIYGKRYIESLQYVDYHLFGSYRTPRLFRRQDAQGNYLSYNQMSWPADMDRVPAKADSERVTFWLAVPRKEVSPRKDGKPAGVVLLGHGYTGSKIVAAEFSGYFARHGLATLAIDNVSHGVDLFGPDIMGTVDLVFGGMGLNGLIDGLLDNRSWDQDLDGKEDSGGDFWTAYAFHTRDVVRQTAVDYMQVMRILRAFDGKRTWAFDANHDGAVDGKDLAGDFDGDGKVDVGGADAVIGMTGSSLGGMMAAFTGGVEPHLSAVVPVCAGGGLSDIGIRSIQGGVREAVELRVMGPLYVGYPQTGGACGTDTACVLVKQVVPRLNGTARVDVAKMVPLAPGDTVLGENLATGELDCAILRDGGAFRVGIASDVNRAKPQRHRLSFFKGNAFVPGLRDPDRGKACTLRSGVNPVTVLERFDFDVDFHFQSAPLTFKKGELLAPIAEGLGLHRARPELRRFIGFAQLALDPGDPAVAAKHFLSDDLKMATGEVVQTHAVVVNTIGDMNVPVSTGTAIGRAAGLVDFATKVPAWGNRTANQVLIDQKVLEAVDVIPHFKSADGKGVLFDPEDLSNSGALGLDGDGQYALGYDGYTAPRLSPPLHTQMVRDDPHGGVSGTFFPYVIPTGKHDLDMPGDHTDRLIKLCGQLADQGKTAPVCEKAKTDGHFDQGALVLEAIAYYLASGGKTWPLNPCQSTWTCPDIPPPPAARK